MFRNAVLMRQSTMCAATVGSALALQQSLFRFERPVARCQEPVVVSVEKPEKPVVVVKQSRVRVAGLGATLGFATGYLMKKIGRVMLMVIGLEFVFLQSLSGIFNGVCATIFIVLIVFA
eukprot:TRINITY_DN1337_c0_g1_i2.p3 TRINITY_DN1337_c0_g1~~TRINITY_DN1337_c0_g1_i2.p3  ORF type:complete len:119 (-),score=11.65 TRINITY_DN1337_c0_g1_i2:241-597(-)